jgi:2-keto-4-pentenoate hydratase
MNPVDAAALLIAARRGGAAVDGRAILPATREQAYAIQDATLAIIGPIAGWKVGAKGPAAEPVCAPLPATCLVPSATRLAGPGWALRGIEVEVAFRVGRDCGVGEEVPKREDLASLFDAILPAIEVVETRLADWRDSPALAQLADLQSHGALVLGKACELREPGIDLPTTAAQLLQNGQVAKSTVGGNPADDVWRLLAWLANHCAARGLPLRKGQYVTTGSCTGMLFARPGDAVEGRIDSLGQVQVSF